MHLESQRLCQKVFAAGGTAQFQRSINFADLVMLKLSHTRSAMLVQFSAVRDETQQKNEQVRFFRRFGRFACLLLQFLKQLRLAHFDKLES